MNTGILIIIIIAAVLAVLIAACVLRSRAEVKCLETARYELHSDKLKDGQNIRMVFISDLHGREYGDDNVQLVETVRQEHPDFILVGGDLLVLKNEAKDANARAFIRSISKIAPIYYAPGNHEKGMMTLKKFRTRKRNYLNFLRSESVKYLSNETVQESGSISITGLDIDYTYYDKLHPQKMTDQAMSSYLGKLDKNRYNIVLAHNPEYFGLYCLNEPDLVLAGHFHGGAIRLPLVGGVISPQFRLFPKYSRGCFIKGKTTMIVSAGCGSHTINLRVFNKPEVVVIDLKPAEYPGKR